MANREDRGRFPPLGPTLWWALLPLGLSGGCQEENALSQSAAPVCLDQGGGSGAVVRKVGACRQVELLAARSFQRSQSADASLLLDPRLAFSLPSSIPVLVGNAGNLSAHLMFTAPGGLVSDCTYRGGSAQAHPTSSAERQKGRQYLFSSCTNGLTPGAAVTGVGFTLRVDGDARDVARAVIAKVVLDELAPCSNLDGGQDAADGDAGRDALDGGSDGDAPGDDRRADGDAALDAPDAAESEASDRDASAVDGDADGPRSERCGDGIRDTILEECDLAASAASQALCTPECRVRDRLVVSSSTDAGVRAKSLGEGRHPLAASADGSFAVVFTEPDESPPNLAMAFFTPNGVAADSVVSVGSGSSTLLFSNPVTAALPNGGYATAYTDFDEDGDELGIALRLVRADRTLSVPIHANATTIFSQYDADLVRTSSGLVVAWVDGSASATAPDLKYRTFDFDLRPTSGELDLATTTATEGEVGLAAWTGGWAAAWRAGENGEETVRVHAGLVDWAIGPFLPAPTTSSPALVELDEHHLLVAYVAGLVPASDSDPTSKLRAAVLDVTSGTVTAVDVPAMVASLQGRSQDRPNAAFVLGHLFLGWRTEAAPGQPEAEELWLKDVSWNGTSLGLETPEIPLPRSSVHRSGDQRRVAFAGARLSPVGEQLITAFDDLGRTFGNAEGTGDVVVEAIPIPILRLGPDNP